MSHVTEDHLSSLLAGFLSERRRAQVARHLARGCRECHATIAAAPPSVLPGPDTLARLVDATAAPRVMQSAETRVEVWARIIERIPALAPAPGLDAPVATAEGASPVEDAPVPEPEPEPEPELEPEP